MSLSGPFGEFRIGRDYTPTFWNDTVFDPFGTNGVGTNVISRLSDTIGNGQYVRSSNSIGYFLPANLGGFYGQAQYGFHEQIDTDGGFDSKQNQYAGARFGYANGPLDVALAYGESTILSTVALETKVKTANLGASYDLGVVKLFGELSRVENDPSIGSSVDLDGALIGVTAPIGAGLIRASYSTVKAKVSGDDPKANKFALGYVHNLSKRTALYATVAHISNKDGANITLGSNLTTSATKSATGYDFGIRHAF